jgi:hypothetical protein
LRSVLKGTTPMTTLFYVTEIPFFDCDNFRQNNCIEWVDICEDMC